MLSLGGGTLADHRHDLIDEREGRFDVLVALLDVVNQDQGLVPFLLGFRGEGKSC